MPAGPEEDEDDLVDAYERAAAQRDQPDERRRVIERDLADERHRAWIVERMAVL
jgi:hypothetical protein